MKRFFKLVSMFVLAGATLTYTGCTDYDKDIDNLGQEVDALEGKLATLEQQVKNLEALKSQLETLKNTHDADVERIGKAIAAINKSLEGYATKTWAEQTFVTKDGLKETIAALGFATSADVKKAQDDATQALGDIAALKKALGKYAEPDAIKNAIEGFDGKIDAALEDALKNDGKITKAIADAIEAATKEFETKFYGELRSLVFIPDLYIGGIEAAEYEYAEYKAIALGDATETGNSHAGAVPFKVTGKIAATTPGATLYNNPEVVVNYEMNPASAKVAAEDLKFIANDVETRAASEIAPVVSGIVSVENGNLAVAMKANGEKAALESDPDHASMFALQATVKTDEGKAVTVTSDYARLVATPVTFKAIAYNNATYVADASCSATGISHLWGTAKAALEANPTVKVVWNKTADLKKILDVHMSDCSVYDMTKNIYGLSYEFNLIDYISGTYETSDSQFASIADGVIDPCGVDAGKRNGVDTKTSIGRRPLVQVLVKDEAGKIVLVGYINVEIVDEAAVPVIVDALPFAIDVKFGCADTTWKSTWAQMVDNILEKAEISKVDFENIYQLEETAGKAVQYTVQGGEYVALAAADYVGEVKGLLDIAMGTTTSVLQWTLAPAAMSEVYKKAGHTTTIYVRYANTTAPGQSGIYVPLKATVSKPVGTVGVKLAEYWFNGGKSAFINTNIPHEGVNAGTAPWETDLNNVWEANKPVFNPTAGYPSFTKEIFAHFNGDPGVGGYKYYFAPEQPSYTIDGVKYELYVKNAFVADKYVPAPTAPVTNASIKEYEDKWAVDVTKGVYANSELFVKKAGVDAGRIAWIDMSTGKPIIKYEATEVSKVLVNNYASQPNRTENAKYFANVGVVAYSPCGIAMSISGAINPYHFLRPINPVFATGKNFVDAAEVNAPESNIDIFDIVDFVDWRNVSFSDNIYYYGFYDVNNVNIDIANVTTDLNGGELGKTKLTDKTANIKLTLKCNGTVAPAAGLSITYPTTTYDAEYVKKALGTINYQNNGSTVREKFTLRIPVTITYTWGTISDYVDVTVNPSMGA